MLKHFFVALLGMMSLAPSVCAAGKSVKLSTGATINIFQADAARANGRGVIVIPGGGYGYIAGDTEGAGWADFYNNLGYTIAVLNYRLPKGNHDVPLTDGRAAMQYLRDHADELQLFPEHIGVMGFSAGGHLASTIATHTSGDERPAFQILFYPVITMEPGRTHQGSIDQLLGNNPSAELIDAFSNQKHVDAAAPPAYITYSDNDGTVPPLTNGKLYYDALVENGVPVTLKTYPTGGHGWGTGDKLGATYKAQMLESLTQWLNALGGLLPTPETFPEATTYVIDADAEALPAFNRLRYPNISSVAVNSAAVAGKNYTTRNNLTALFGTAVEEYAFGEGVTKLGNNILSGAEGLERLLLPSTLESIGASALTKTAIATVSMPAVREVKSLAFAICRQLQAVEFGADIDTIYANAFKGCTALTSITCHRPTPPRAAETFVDASQRESIVLRVPQGSAAAYAANPVWSGFARVEEMTDETAIRNVATTSDRRQTAYALDGRRIAPNHASGIVIVGGRKLAIR